MLSLYNRIFKVESPARRLMQHLLSRFILCRLTVPGTLLERMVPTKQAFNLQFISKTSEPNNDSHFDSIIHLLFTDNFNKLYCHVCWLGDITVSCHVYWLGDITASCPVSAAGAADPRQRETDASGRRRLSRPQPLSPDRLARRSHPHWRTPRRG